MPDKENAEKAKGKMKEAAGALSGDESRKDEGRAQQRKADAEKERDKKSGNKGLLGDVGDTLSGR